MSQLLAPVGDSVYDFWWQPHFVGTKSWVKPLQFLACSCVCRRASFNRENASGENPGRTNVATRREKGWSLRWLCSKIRLQGKIKAAHGCGLRCLSYTLTRLSHETLKTCGIRCFEPVLFAEVLAQFVSSSESLILWEILASNTTKGFWTGVQIAVRGFCLCG